MLSRQATAFLRLTLSPTDREWLNADRRLLEIYGAEGLVGLSLWLST